MSKRRNFFKELWKPIESAELQRSAEPYLGELALVAFNFAPRGWALCNGQLLPISSNTALFSILGTQYGGNGTTTFALPNLQGKMLIGAGQGPGLSDRTIGEIGGEETVMLQSTEMPAHNHPTISPANVMVRGTGAAQYGLTTGKSTGTSFSAEIAGGGQAHNNMQPYLTLYYIIALEGIFPPRS